VAGPYTGTQTVTISTATAGASIRYTTNGSTPSATAGTLYTVPVSIASSLTLKAIAYKTGIGNSAVISGAYTIKVVDPTFSPVAGSYTGTQPVTIGTTTAGASIRYTTDGSTPTSSVGALYSAAVQVSATTTLKAIAFKTGLTDSAVVTAAYTIAVVAPAFSPVAGSYTGTQPVTITTTTSAASIRYTTDGSTPTSSVGTLYSAAVPVTATTTLKAIAYKTGMADSTVATAAYTIAVVAPTFSPVAGTYTAAQSVTIGTITSGASIRYTIDGSTPTSAVGTLYSSPVAISTTTTLKAIAYKIGMADSTVLSGTYAIVPPIVRTARGVFQDKTSTAAWTVGNIAVSSGEALFVVVGANAATLPTVTWGGTALTQNNSLTTASTAAVAIYSLLSPTPATQSLVITWSGTIPSARSCAATTVSGLVLSSAADTNVAAKNGNVTSTSPSTGASGTSAQAREFIFAGVLTQGPSGDTAGTATAPFTLGQRLGTTGGTATTNVTIQELYDIANSAGTFTAAETAITSRKWWAIEQGYKALTQ
jgi:hypothetical protein